MRIQPNKLIGFFHGIDPASQNDFYTNVVHALTEKPKSNAKEHASEFSWLPHLVSVKRFRKRAPMEIMDIQIRQFNRFPPMICTIDSTREEFLSNALVRKYGDTTIIPLKFSNSGSTNTKFMLKQIGYAYLHGGYIWPELNELEKTRPKYAQMIKILKNEMYMEQVKYTDTGKVTFQHPVGKHNDLVHGWEMSLKSVMDFQQKKLGYEKRKINNKDYQNIISNRYDNVEKMAIFSTFDNLMPGSAFSIP